MEHPLVTVITPTYNRADYLPETIESVLSQDYPNVEYIVLDDGSIDNTREVLERYSGRLTWKLHPNMGEARTVNKGWRMACGEFVFTVNSDDPVLPGLIGTSVEVMLSNPEVLVTYPNWVIIDAQSRQVEQRLAHDFNYINMIRWHMCMPGPGSCIRRSAFDLEALRDPSFRFVGDYDFYLRLGMHGPFMHIPQILATWREHSGSITISERHGVMEEEHVRVLDRLYARPDLPLDALRVRNEAYSAAYYAVGTGLSGNAARRCYGKSIMLHLNSHPWGAPRSWKVMLATFFVPDHFLQRTLVRRHQAKRERALEEKQ